MPGVRRSIDQLNRLQLAKQAISLIAKRVLEEQQK
jgi:hypothetical protein